MLADITEYLDNKIEQNSKRLIFTFYELRIKMDLTEPTVEKFLRLSETRLINLGYQTYRPGEIYEYQGEKQSVNENELLIAIKE
jgi:hypothetical protein